MGALEVESPAGEGSVNWAAAREFALGKEAAADEAEAGDAAATETAAEREFRYKGKTIKVDSETAELLEDLRKQARGQNGRLGAELARTRERLARLEGAVTAPKREEAPPERPRRPDPALAVRDFAEYDRQRAAYEAAVEADLEARMTARLEAERERDRRAAESERKNTEWATRFYSSYDHLDNPILKPLVAQVYTEHKAEIDEIEATEGLERAHDHLSTLADKRIVEVNKVVKSNPNNSRRPPRIESSGGTPPRREAPPEPTKSFSAASWSAKERARMRGDGAK